MTLEKQVTKKIIRDVLVSILIYALPVALMFLTFYFSGQKPWQKKQNETEVKK